MKIDAPVISKPNLPIGSLLMSSKDDATNLPVPAVLSDDESSSSVPKEGTDSDESKSSYRDFSQVRPEKHDGPSSLIAQSTTAKEPTFPVKLHMILSNPEFQDIISWLPHGRSWRILAQKAFEERVIPLYFRHGRYSSFARQVNGWGFRRVIHGSDYNSYYHEMFLRGMPHLCQKMRRLTSRDNGNRKKGDEEQTPDFYAMSRENPLPENPQVQTAIVAPQAFAVPPTAGNNIVATSTVGGSAIGDVQYALLERHRADILGRINMLASSKALRQDSLVSPGLAQQGVLQGGLAAALGTAGSSQQPFSSFSHGHPGANHVGNANAALQRQLLGAHLANSNLSNLLALQGHGVGGAVQGQPQQGQLQDQFQGQLPGQFQGFLGNPFGL